jgi:prepilin-type N-terminal cleavage/methylation domain-containing protein
MAQDPVNHRAASGGFTLIEVLIAMTLTALAIMGIIALYITETKASGFSRHTTEASVLAQGKVEELRNQGSAVDIGSAGSPQSEANIGALGSGSTGMYTRLYYETVGSNYAEIGVTVQWNDDGTDHTVTVTGRRGVP